MIWKEPPVIKIYEALGAVADGRVKVEGNTAQVYSSSGNKFYEVVYDPKTKAITANDNGSFYQGYVGYPMIAFLMVKGVMEYSTLWADALKGFAWKDMNVKYKNDWEKTTAYIRDELDKRGHSLVDFDLEIDRVMTQIRELQLSRLPSKNKPPTSY